MTGDPLDRIDFGEYPYLIRVPGDSPERKFVATNAVTAEGAVAADWEVIDLEALVEVARAARKAWDADERSAGAWTATGERAVKDLAAALDDIGAALARLDKDTT